jgi:hypothetical protein
VKRTTPASPRIADAPRAITVRAVGDRGDLEAFQLEIRRLAREHGFEVVDVRIERARRSRPPRSA